MKIITGILLHALLGSIQFEHADGAPMLLAPFEIFVEMGDFSNYIGKIKKARSNDGADHIPRWMHYGQEEFANQVSTFILTDFGEHYEANLTTTNRPWHHDPHPSRPAICEIRLGGFRYYAATFFELYLPPPFDHPDFNAYPPRDRIYITFRGGPIWSTELRAPHQLARSHPNSPSSPHSPNSPVRPTY